VSVVLGLPPETEQCSDENLWRLNFKVEKSQFANRSTIIGITVGIMLNHLFFRLRIEKGARHTIIDW